MALSMHRESNSKQQQMDASKYVRYTPEQVEALERVYAECPKPSSLRRQQLIRECPILCNIEPKQIKVWFQNRRYMLPKDVKNVGINEFGFFETCGSQFSSLEDEFSRSILGFAFPGSSLINVSAVCFFCREFS